MGQGSAESWTSLTPLNPIPLNPKRVIIIFILSPQYKKLENKMPSNSHSDLCNFFLKLFSIIKFTTKKEGLSMNHRLTLCNYYDVANWFLPANKRPSSSFNPSFIHEYWQFCLASTTGTCDKTSLTYLANNSIRFKLKKKVGFFFFCALLVNE